MLIVLGLAVLVLAIGMVVLFAMLGELSARVAERGTATRSTRIRTLERANIGRIPGSWPPALGDPGLGEFTLLVLSSACTSCADVAGQLTGSPGHADWTDMAVLVSTAHLQTGENFVGKHGLGSLPHYIDVGGDWVQGEFGVRMSPTALVFRSGQLTAAYEFNDVAALRAKLRQEVPAESRN
jgi:hypothetical protein